MVAASAMGCTEGGGRGHGAVRAQGEEGKEAVAASRVNAKARLVRRLRRRRRREAAHPHLLADNVG